VFRARSVAAVRPDGSWETAGAKELFVKLNERVKEMLETHQPDPLSEDAEKKIAQILAAPEALEE